MDKFLIRKRKNDNNLPESDEVTTSDISSSLDAKAPKITKLKNRKYSEDYLSFGFTWTGDEGCPQPKCLVCGAILANQSMAPNKLKRHLEQNHHHVAQKPVGYFRSLHSNQEKAAQKMERRLKVSDKALVASYKVSELIALNKKSHNIGEKIIIPACREIVKLMFGNEAVEQIDKIPLSNDTVKRRITDMSEDIECIVVEKMRECKKFALQLDESTDVSNKARLMVFVRFESEARIIEQFLFCKELTTSTTGADVFYVVNAYLQEKQLKWEYCCSICTDGAAAMTGRIKGFISIAKKENPSITSVHCFLHREALMMKSSDGGPLGEVLKSVISMINYIKTRPVKSRIFEQLCSEMGAEHKTLLLHSEIRWLSRGKILTRVFELCNEMELFFEGEKPEFCEHLNNAVWKAELAYLADIFQKLNFLNSSMQGKNETIISATDKMNGFSKKLEFWTSTVENGDFTCFANTSKVISSLMADQVHELGKIIKAHLEKIKEGLIKYFPSVSTAEIQWVISPFGHSGEENLQSAAGLTNEEREQLIDIHTNSLLNAKFVEMGVSSFWTCADLKRDYPAITNKAMDTLLPFATTYLCESAFSAMKALKSKYRTRLNDVDAEMRVSLSDIRPRIDVLCTKKQSQVSH